MRQREKKISMFNGKLKGSQNPTSILVFLTRVGDMEIRLAAFSLYISIYAFMYCRFGNIRENLFFFFLLIFANLFPRKFRVLDGIENT